PLGGHSSVGALARWRVGALARCALRVQYVRLRHDDPAPGHRREQQAGCSRFLQHSTRRGMERPRMKRANAQPATRERASAGTRERGNAIDVLGVRVDDVTYPEALALLLDAIAARTSTVVTTPNPEFVMLARRDASFRRVLNR